VYKTSLAKKGTTGLFFSKEAEKSYDRSIENFIGEQKK